jgi:hypothetical protein
MRIGKAPPLPRKLIDIRRLKLCGPIAAEIAVPEIVGEDHNHIRPLICGQLLAGDGRCYKNDGRK